MEPNLYSPSVDFNMILECTRKKKITLNPFAAFVASKPWCEYGANMPLGFNSVEIVNEPVLLIFAKILHFWLVYIWVFYPSC